MISSSTDKSPDACVPLQQNHDELMCVYKEEDTSMNVPESAGNSWKNRKKEEKQLIDSLLAHFSKSHQSYSKTNVRRRAERVFSPELLHYELFVFM